MLRARAAALEAAAGGRARPALGRAVRGQGQYRRRGPADHRRLPRLRLHARARRRPRSSGCSRAGAILVGKTNLDQFATGLVGVRSPYGVARNPFDPTFIPGGSSSGSAVAVAPGLVSFALGTDTAGSGRVPAAFNNIVGLKPTKGLIPTKGVVPACRSLDCVSIFALTAADAAAVLEVAGGFDAAGPVLARASRSGRRAASPACRFGVPPPGRSASSSAMRRPSALYDAALERATGWAPSWSRSTSRRSWRRPSCSTPGPGSPSAPRRSASSWPPTRTRSGRRRAP